MRSRRFHIVWLLGLLVYLAACSANHNGTEANAGSDQMVLGGQVFQLNGLLSSVSTGLARHYKWRQVSGPLVEFNDSTLAMPRVTAPHVASRQVLRFELEVIDEQLVADTDEVSITVLPDEPLPEVPGDILLVHGQGDYQTDDSIELKVIWSGDQTAPMSNCTWKQVRGKSVDFTVSDSTLSLSMIAPFVEQREALEFQIKAEMASGGELVVKAEVVVLPTQYPMLEVSGFVKTVNSEPLAGVQVRVIEDGLVNDESLLTELDGAFSFQLEQGLDYVLAFVKDGYVEQVIPVVQQSTGEAYFINSVMVQPAETVNFNQDERVDFIASNGARVVFNKNQFVDDQGLVLSGDLEVAVTTTTVDRSSGSQAYFGLFAGFMKDSVDSVIVSNLGMAKFSFSHQGKPVDLEFGEVVEILIPLHSDHFDDGVPIQIGDDVPLWSFNVSRGVWEQEGDGTVEESMSSPTGLAMRSELSQLSW